MKKSTKIWLIIAICLVVGGLVLFASALSMADWDFSQLSTDNYETSHHEINVDFRNISVQTDAADITFARSDDETCRVVCKEPKEAKHSVSVLADTLVIKLVDEKAWYNFIGFSFSSPSITVYLPRTQYGKLSIGGDTGRVKLPSDFSFESTDITLDTGSAEISASVSTLLKVETSTGSIHYTDACAGSIDLTTSTGMITVSDVTCRGDVRLEVSTGMTKLTNVSCENLTSYGDTGGLTLRDVLASGKISAERETGDIEFDGADAAEIFVQTDTGDVEGSLLSDKIFYAQTDTGSVDVPRSVTGGICEITTDTGDIDLTIRN